MCYSKRFFANIYAAVRSRMSMPKQPQTYYYLSRSIQDGSPTYRNLSPFGVIAIGQTERQMALSDFQAIPPTFS